MSLRLVFKAETVKFLDSTSIFEGLTKKQKIGLAEATFSEVFEDKAFKTIDFKSF